MPECFFAGIHRDNEAKNRHTDYVNSMQDWQKFVPKTLTRFGVDMTCLSSEFEKEHADYYLSSSVWCELRPADLLTNSTQILSIDCNTCKLEDYISVNYQFNLNVHYKFNTSHSKANPGRGGQSRSGGINPPPRNNRTEPIRLSGFAGWFEVDFLGSTQNPALSKVTLSTAPHIGYTHWGQQCFFLHPSVAIHDADRVEGYVNIVRRKDYQRLMNVEIGYRLKQKEHNLTEDTIHLFHME